MKRTLVIAEIDADGPRCGSCAHARSFVLPVNGRPRATACRLFGGVTVGGMRTDECKAAEIEAQAAGIWATDDGEAAA